MAAVGAAVATHDDLQGRGSPPERFVRKPPDHRVPRNPFAAAATAPLVELDDAASDHRAVGLEPLPNGFETELIQSAERGQVRASEGSVVHVEVFRMGSVRTSILGRPRLLSRHRRAVSFYTLICEEPIKDSLEREYLEIRERLQRLGYTMVAESRFPFDLPPATGPR